MKLNKITKIARFVILMLILALVTYESYMHQVLGGGKAPSIHALCPFGALESLYAIIFAGTFIKKVYTGTVVLLVLTVTLAVIFRRSFCGLLCPFGALQELFAKIGQLIFKKKFIIPSKIDKPLRYFKYVVLVATVGMAWYYGTLWMAPYDPYSAYSHITVISDSIKEDPVSIVGFILLSAILIGSLLYDRFFCKYMCPMGAFYGIIGKISPTRVERNENLCVNCNACSKACPANIEVSKETKINSAECLNCNKCVLSCPKKGALEVKTAKKALHPIAVISIVVALFFGTIFIAKATGNFEVLSSTQKAGQTIPVSELKGYHTIEEAAKVTGLSIDEVYEKLGIPKSVAKSTKMKEISKEVPDFSFDKAKENSK